MDAVSQEGWSVNLKSFLMVASVVALVVTAAALCTVMPPLGIAVLAATVGVASVMLAERAEAPVVEKKEEAGSVEAFHAFKDRFNEVKEQGLKEEKTQQAEEKAEEEVKSTPTQGMS